MSTRHVVTTCTRDCANTCGLQATVENGRLVKLAGNPDHPLTRGVACHKARKYVARVYHPERVTHPLIRRGGEWERATWDEALDLVAQRMKAIRDESGNEAILYYQGYGERTALKLLNRYFFNLFGGVTTLRGSLCGGTGQASQNLDVGERVSHDPLDHYNSASMIFWARNPVSTNISLVPIARDVRGRGGRVILVDPARTRSASLADRHIAPRPGRDAWLALAVARLIVMAGKEDRDFLENRCEGGREFRLLLESRSVEEFCALAGVPAQDAHYLAETLMTQRPTSILMGWGLHRHEYAHQSIRAVDALGATAGLIGVPGGGVSQGFEEYGPYDQQYWGDGLNPPRRTLLLPRVGEEILAARDPEIRMIFVTAANPVCMAPNSEKVARAFRKAEFVVYSGHFLDDTAECAHVFLPATTFLEEEDVMASYGHNYVGPVNRAIEPVGQCRSEYRMFHALASRFPFAHYFQREEADWLHDLCAPLRGHGCDMEELKERAFRWPAPMVPYQDRTFATPSGKFRLLTSLDPASLAAPDPVHPYRLLTVAPHGFICSELSMAEHDSLPQLRLNAGEARAKGLEDGQPVLVKSSVGQAMARLRAEEGLRADVAVAERGGWIKAGHGLNRLTRDLASKVGQGTPYYETSVDVTACPDGGPAGLRVLVVRHSELAPGGNFVKWLEREGALVLEVHPAKGDALPDTPEGFDALVVLGGPQHAWDDEGSPHFPHLLELLRAFDALDRPVAGICLGAQLLARAHGGGNRTMEFLEYGFTRLSLTAEGREDPVVGGAEPPRLMEFHEDTFDLPEGAALLMRGERCEAQCFRAGRASYGFQFHLEADSAILAEWIRLFREERIEAYKGARDQYDEAFFQEMRDALPVLAARQEAFCARTARAWLGLAASRRKASPA